MSLLWVMRILLWAFIICIVVFTFLVFQPVPYAHIDRIDENGTVWVQLGNISENSTVYLYYGEEVNSKQVWIIN